MKKLCLLWMLVLAAACQQQPLPDNQSGQDTAADMVTFKAIIERRYLETKAFPDVAIASWCEGDQIRVFNAENPDGVVFSLCAGEGSTEGTFTGERPSGEGPFFFVYPASLAGTLSEESITGVVLPATQDFFRSGPGSGAGIAVGRASSLYARHAFVLKNLDALLLIPLKGSKKVTRMIFYSGGGEPLCGAATLSIPEKGDPSLNLAGDRSDGANRRLTLDCRRRGVQLSHFGAVFGLCVPAGSLSQGLIVEVLDNEQNAMLAYVEPDAPIERNSIREMPQVSYSPDVKAAFLEPDMVTFPESVEAGGFTGVRAADMPFKPCCPYICAEGQYSCSTTDGIRNMRIQDWQRGFALNLAVDAGASLVPGATNDVVVTAYGNTGGITSGQATMQVLKKDGSRVWLFDGANGYIVFWGE